MSLSAPSRNRHIAKRACDACKIRRVRCSGGQPCEGCTKAKMECTFKKIPLTRGPQKLRASTRQLIAEIQQEGHYEENITSYCFPQTCASKNRSRIPTSLIAQQLYVYRLRMFPVWPIVNVEEVIAALQRDEDDPEMYALATAVVAATMAQIKLAPPVEFKHMTADVIEAECQRARSQYSYREQTNLTTLRTAFFLHVYHENQEKGGGASSLYLRESISIAQMMGLHRESSYKDLALQEQQLRRRVLWLLFITERLGQHFLLSSFVVSPVFTISRGVCILHKLPVILKVANVSLPAVDNDDESHVLPAFLNLVNLFWTFDQSGMFEVLQDQETESTAFINDLNYHDGDQFHLLQAQLEQDPLGGHSINDVQKADIWVTRQWMRTILWKMATKNGLLALNGADQTISPSFPVTVAQEFLTITSRLPESAMEAHGLAMVCRTTRVLTRLPAYTFQELKIYEIASSVADSISTASDFLPRGLSGDLENQPRNILSCLHQILSSFRGGNKTLVDMLCKKMAYAHQYGMTAIPTSIPGPISSTTVKCPKISEISDGEDDGSGAIFYDSELDRGEILRSQLLSRKPYSTILQDSPAPERDNLSSETPAQYNQQMNTQTQDFEW